MSDPQNLRSAAVAAMPSHSATFTIGAEQYSTSSSLSNTQLLEQLLSTPTVSSATSAATPQAAESFQSSSSSVLSQLLTQHSSPSAAAVQMPARDSSALGGTQDPSLLNQLYHLKQVLQKQTVPTELVNALNSLSNTGAVQGTQQQKQDQAQAVQPMQLVQQQTAPPRPSLQMKPQNQNAITQALQSLLRAPPNVTIQPSTSNKQMTQVNSFTSQSPLQAPIVASHTTQVPTVTIRHQPQSKLPVTTVNQNILPSTAVIVTPQGGLQAAGLSVQDARTEQMNNVPEVVTTSMQQVVNIGHPAVQGQRILLPANVNLSTLSLAQLGLTPAALQSVTVPSSVANCSSSFSTVATMSSGATSPLAVTVSSTGLVTESQDTGEMRPGQTLATAAKQTRPVTAEQREQYKVCYGFNLKHRRISHITAEQKRRGNIKMGFDQLMSLVPALANQRNSKVSKATVLQKK
ncbi:hypothetical protein OS493_015925 [Desmophyllum pertusum]|uniref:BHLH domain-containing protein n=1 Tax=Desmophyllum pertusum TaxID=174260 RepID=A0A9W9YCQ3_9CNID|nr:hypothetical protein OS493_015925 [Desmophyllum pertusum]